MPKTKLADKLKAQTSRYDPLMELIGGKMFAKRITPEEVCAAVGFGTTCWRSRKKAPWTFRLEELEAISKCLNIPWREMLEAVSLAKL